MYDKELVGSILKNILCSIEQITKRSQSVQSSEDFLKDDLGLEKLDSICMQLINTGQALKEIDRLGVILGKTMFIRVENELE